MGIVPTLDEVKRGLAGLLPRTQLTTIQESALQGCEETLTEGVVVAVTDRSHGRADAGLPAMFPEGDRGVLAALVGVVDHPRRTPLLDGHSQGIQDQFGAQMRGHRPAHHPTAPGVDDDGEIQQPGPGWRCR